MEEFFHKYLPLIRFVLYILAVFLSLGVVFFSLRILPALSIAWASSQPFLLALFLAYLIFPLILRIEKLGLPRFLAILLFYLAIFGGLMLGVYWLLPTLLAEMYELGRNLPQYLHVIYRNFPILEQYFGVEVLRNQANMWIETLTTNTEQLNAWLFNMLLKFMDSLIFVMIVPVALFYFLRDYEKITRMTLGSFPRKYRHNLVAFGGLLNNTLAIYLRGLVLITLILSLLATLLLTLVGINYALFFGFFIGISSLLPLIGGVIGLLPVLLVAATISWQHVLTVIAMQFLLHMIEANILHPLVIGRKLEIHPLLMMILMFVGVRTLGMIGILLAVPAFLFIRAWLHSNHRGC